MRSYRTVSPLPVPLARPSAVYSLLHFPSPYDARALPGTLPCGARTFLQRSKPLAILTRTLIWTVTSWLTCIYRRPVRPRLASAPPISSGP